MIAGTITLLLAHAVVVDGLGRLADRLAPLSTPVLKGRLTEAQARLWAWEVEYESAREERPGVPSKSYLHRIVAAKAPDLFFHCSAHGTPQLDWREDPYQQRLTVTAERMFSERPLDRFFIEWRVRPDQPLPGRAPELLLIALGWWPLTMRPAVLLDDKLPASLSAVAQSSAYHVRSSLEQAGGRWCHVLEFPGRDQLWIDVDRGCAVVARQIDYSIPARRVHRVEFADFREMLPNVWVPFRLRNLIYERARDGTVGPPVLDATLHVRQVLLNEAVDDARFRFSPLPGSVARIDDQPLRQVVPSGEEYLDDVVRWIRRYDEQPEVTRSQTLPVSWSDVALGALLGAVVVGALLWWARCRAIWGGGS
jgi:hypothetical protein